MFDLGSDRIKWKKKAQTAFQHSFLRQLIKVQEVRKGTQPPEGSKRAKGKEMEVLISRYNDIKVTWDQLYFSCTSRHLDKKIKGTIFGEAVWASL